MPWRWLAWLARPGASLGVILTMAVGCGSGASSHRTSAPRAATPSAPARADPAAVAVIRGWSDTLRRGDVPGAARYFALPSLMINGPDAGGQVVAVNIRTRAEAEAANESLPCGARLISAAQQGRYVNALFALTNRSGPGGGCGTGAGQTARTNFVIRRGRIVDWIRAPSLPGDNPSAPQVPPASGNSTPSV
jgi:uncharacterized spore protein YtfJ